MLYPEQRESILSAQLEEKLARLEREACRLRKASEARDTDFQTWLLLYGTSFSELERMARTLRPKFNQGELFDL